MFRLLKWEAQLVYAVLGLVFRFGIWLAGLPFRNRSQPHAAPQLPRQPVPAALAPVPSATPASAAPPTIHVTVNLPLEALARPAAPKPQLPPAHPSAATILAHPDHRIYVSSGSQLIFPHPREAELLEMLDRMLYVAAHRDGAPFTIPPALDDSVPPPDGELVMPPPLDDGGIDAGPLRPLPPHDDGLWLALAGQAFQKLPPPTPPPVKPAPEPVIEPLPEDEIFTAGVPHTLPPQDGALWRLRLGHKPERVTGN